MLRPTCRGFRRVSRPNPSSRDQHQEVTQIHPDGGGLFALAAIAAWEASRTVVANEAPGSADAPSAGKLPLSLRIEIMMNYIVVDGEPLP
jgi:hypothetical protein